MSEPYSLKRAAGWGAAGLGVSTLTGIFYAVVHHAQNHFETLQEAFMHVAQPEFIASAIILSAAFGAFMEFRRWYNANIDAEEAQKEKPDRIKTPRTEVNAGRQENKPDTTPQRHI